MGRYERNAYFERLVELRMGYGRSADDTHGVLLVADAIAYVEAVMTAWDLEDELEMAIVSDAAGESVAAGEGVAAVEPLEVEPGDSSSPRGAPVAHGNPLERIDAAADARRAERMARLSRFFDPTYRRSVESA